MASSFCTTNIDEFNAAAMMRGEAETLLNCHVCLVRAGPEYVQKNDATGVVIEVIESELFIINPRKPDEHPRDGFLQRYQEPTQSW